MIFQEKRKREHIRSRQLPWFRTLWISGSVMANVGFTAKAAVEIDRIIVEASTIANHFFIESPPFGKF